MNINMISINHSIVYRIHYPYNKWKVPAERIVTTTITLIFFDMAFSDNFEMSMSKYFKPL